MKKLSTFIASAFVSFFFLNPVFAVEPDEILDDPVLEERARTLSKGLRCVVCQNQSIDDSDADLAKDMRIIVRERLTAGDNDEEVINFLVDRYGDYVLLKTPLKTETILLWVSPAILVLLAVLGVGYWYRGRVRESVAAGPAKTKPLTKDEQARLNALLKDE